MIFDFQMEERVFGMLEGVGRPLFGVTYRGWSYFIYLIAQIEMTLTAAKGFAILPSRKDPLSLHGSVIHPQR